MVSISFEKIRHLSTASATVRKIWSCEGVGEPSARRGAPKRWILILVSRNRSFLGHSYNVSSREGSTVLSLNFQLCRFVE